MAYRIDTREIRRIARKTGEISAEAGELPRQEFKPVRQSAEEYFEGDAAQALEEALEELSDSAVKLSRNLDRIRAEMMAYADRLDKIDEDMAKAIAQS